MFSTDTLSLENFDLGYMPKHNSVYGRWEGTVYMSAYRRT
jgi:hypothetical protein